jgi:Rieske [2Fe-2S] domain
LGSPLAINRSHLIASGNGAPQVGSGGDGGHSAARENIFGMLHLTTPFTILYPAKALDPIKPALILPEVVDASKWWGGNHHYMDPEGNSIFVFLGSVEAPNFYFNKNLVDPKEFQSYTDALKAKWRGKIVALDPRQPGRQRVGARFIYHLPDLGPPFLTRLFNEMEMTLSPDDRQAMDCLGVGKFSLCLFWYPIAAAPELARHPTKFVKILGEELVLFKDAQGQLGLIDAYCAHRRANLTYGIRRVMA